MSSSKKTILIIFFLLLISLSAQHKGRRKGIAFPKPVGIEIHVIPLDSLFTCFISFKVAFDHLVFLKENGKFKSSISLAIEIEKDDEIVERVIKESSAVTDDYSLTKSRNLFLQDLTSVNLPKGEYIFYPIFAIENTDIEVKLKPLNVTIDSTKLSIPLVVHRDKFNIENKEVNKLSNSENTIPYSINEYDLLIPVFDSSITSVDIEIFQKKKIALKQRINEFESLNIKLDSYENHIIIINNNEFPQANLFKLKYVNKNLFEGMSKIVIKTVNWTEEYQIPVLWNSKPNSLRDPESAIGMLKLIGKNDDADSLLDFPDEEYYYALFDYWNTYDSDTSNAFNEVFDEFYSRVDYANKHFKSLNENLGAQSDRGIVYVKYGEPDSIERTYNAKNNIIEIWDYKLLDKKIYFSDKTGTGNFKRIK